MNLDQAKEIKNAHIKIIGMANPLKMDIIDVIVEPLGIGETFRTEYIKLLMEFGNVSNDKLLQNFTADNYKVSVVLDYDGGLTNFGFDDIKRYSHLI